MVNKMTPISVSCVMAIGIIIQPNCNCLPGDGDTGVDGFELLLLSSRTITR